MRAQHNTYMNRSIISKSISLVLGLMIILLLTLSFSALATAKHTHAAQRESYTTYESIRIEHGDTLWNIAEHYSDARHTNAFVKEVKALNGLTTDKIYPGAYLLIPITNY